MLTFIQHYWDALLAMTAEMAPYLLLGFFIAGLLRTFVPHGLYSRHLAPRTMGSVVKAALLGIPLPLCSCGVIPTSVGLRREGASHGACTSFLIATPQTGVDSIAATYSLMGLPFAIVRPVAALFTAMFGGFMVNKFAREDEALSAQAAQSHEHDHCECGCECEAHGAHPQPLPGEGSQDGHRTAHPQPLTEEGSPVGQGADCNELPSSGRGRGWAVHRGATGGPTFWQKLRGALDYGFVDMMQDVGKWLVIGLLIAALITVAVPNEWLAALHEYKLLNMLIVLAIAIPMYVCATGSIPIAVSLMAKGLTPGAALVLLMAGPAVNSASILVIGKVFGRRTLSLYVLSIVIGAMLFGLAIDYLLPQQWFAVSSAVAGGTHCAHCLSGWDWLFVGLLVLLLVNAFAHRHTHHHHHEHEHDGHDHDCHCQEHQHTHDHDHDCHCHEHEHDGQDADQHGHESGHEGQDSNHEGQDGGHAHGHDGSHAPSSHAATVPGASASGPTPSSTPARYKVRGMSCNHCKAAVEKAIARVPGVTSVAVDLPSGTAYVTGTHDPAAIIAAVSTIGYEAEA